MSGVDIAKKELRSRFSAIRDGINRDVRAEKSRIICEKFLDLPQYKSAETVMIYISFRSEAETAMIAEDILRSGRRLIVPKCAEKENKILPCVIESLDELSAGRYGIPEPRYVRLCGKSEIDISAVPALSFDTGNFRLGYGGGYYDRFLEDYGGFSAGLCFSECITDTLPRGENDARVDIVLTD